MSVTIDEVLTKCKFRHYFDLALSVVPMPKQSVSVGKFSKYIPKRQKDYIKELTHQIEFQWGERIPLDCYVYVDVIFTFPFRDVDKHQQSFIFTTVNKDLENLEKPLFDSMKGIVFKDDKQIIGKRAFKVRMHTPGIMVHIFNVLLR